MPTRVALVPARRELDGSMERPPAAAMNAALLDWHEANRRQLAFREAADPYAILVSEVMLQQTQVARVEPVWRAFVARFPDPAALAAAPTAEVLRAWGGLGYNRRAVNLQRTARRILELHGGYVPRDLQELERLPGVGIYTARAVAAIAHGRPVAAVDTNLRRVLGRLLVGHGTTADPGVALTAPALQAEADALVDRLRPAAWTHALMDLGSGVCRPRLPVCSACPVRSWCRGAGVVGVAPTGRVRSAAAHPPLRKGAMPPFETTRRWLRGRLVRDLRAAPDAAWVPFRWAVGPHGPPAVREALTALAAEGLVELDGRDSARLPIG